MRRYYSVRTGKNPNSGPIDLDTLKAMFRLLYNELQAAGYFQEHFGYDCVDAGSVSGRLGPDVQAQIQFRLRKSNLWPMHERLQSYSEEDLFDLIEFLFDHVSKPLDGWYHEFSGCGYHYSTFDSRAGQVEYRTRVNEALAEYQEGLSLSEHGELINSGPKGIASLLKANLPTTDIKIANRIEAAIARFKRHRSSLDERRNAVRDLVDVLEFLRPQLKKVITKADENDLFNIANNFNLRHFNERQKTGYDQAIWLSWMFYFYLATIHACMRMLERVSRDGGA